MRREDGNAPQLSTRLGQGTEFDEVAVANSIDEVLLLEITGIHDVIVEENSSK
jgi:hypothetical protein